MQALNYEMIMKSFFDNLFPIRIVPLRLAGLFFLDLSAHIQPLEAFPDKLYAGSFVVLLIGGAAGSMSWW